jgi:hypothetical protein
VEFLDGFDGGIDDGTYSVDLEAESLELRVGKL